MKPETKNQKPETVSVVAYIANAVTIEEDGWAQLAPFGDFPGRAVLLDQGVPESFDAVQRLDRLAAQQMADHFKSPLNRVKRFFKSCPIFLGHPDDPARGAQYPDKTPKGAIMDLAVREAGLYCLPSFFNEAADLLQKQKLYFSGRWSSEFVQEENGKKIFRPDQFLSAGLTTHPNLPVEWLNEAESTPNPNPEMKITQLITALAPYGITLANDATDTQTMDALHQLGRKADSAAAIANDKSALETQLAAARASFVNERHARIKTILDAALTRGQITEAERPTWESRLQVEANFSNEAAALAQLQPRLKTAPRDVNVGARKVGIANESQRREIVAELVAAKMKDGLKYAAAFAAVQKENPALFEAMKQPEKK